MTSALAPLIAALSDAKNTQPDAPFVIGRVVDTSSTDSLVCIDGEATPGQKRYRWVGSTGPEPGQRVVLGKVAKTYVILGPISGHDLRPQYYRPGASAGAFSSQSNWGKPRYRKDPSGKVWLEGLLAGVGDQVPFLTLPEGFRPAHNLIFNAGADTGSISAVVRSDGVVYTLGAASAFLSLDGISFFAEDNGSGPVWHDLIPYLQNGFGPWGDPYYSPPQYCVDNVGDVHLSGLLSMPTTNAAIVVLPPEISPNVANVYTCRHGNGSIRIDYDPSGRTLTCISGTANTWLSLDGIVFPADAMWDPITLINSWANYNAGWCPAQMHCNPNGVVSFRGLITAGTVNTDCLAAPKAILPEYDKLFMGISNTGIMRIDMYGSIGTMRPAVAFSGGSNAFVTLTGVRYLLG